MVDILYSRIGANSFIGFNENREGFLVDPGYNVGNILIDHIKKLGVKIVAILITHGHFDHIHALEEVCNEFPDANVYISEDEVEFLTNTDLNLSLEPELADICKGHCSHEGGRSHVDGEQNPGKKYTHLIISEHLS